MLLNKVCHVLNCSGLLCVHIAIVAVFNVAPKSLYCPSAICVLFYFISAMEIPENAPEHCPGTQSDLAGKSAPCAGCPNQSLCASGAAKGVDPALEEIRNRMTTVKHKILVLSGKGGVGKSTFSSLLARSLADSNTDRQVALLDVDICGPSQPRIMGVEGEQIHQSLSGWSPVFVEENLCVMSVGFLLGGPDEGKTE